jgi:hypothetical protein
MVNGDGLEKLGSRILDLYASALPVQKHARGCAELIDGPAAARTIDLCWRSSIDLQPLAIDRLALPMSS